MLSIASAAPSRSRRTVRTAMTVPTVMAPLDLTPSPLNADAAKGSRSTFHTLRHGCTVGYRRFYDGCNDDTWTYLDH